MKTKKEVLKEMLTENTGIAMMDSGGENGRFWQRNQNIDFDAQPPIEWDEDGVTFNVYHWLAERVERTEAAERLERMFKAAYPDSQQLADMEEFVEDIGASDIHGEGQPRAFNTYNRECLLSQTLQGIEFNLQNKTFVLLQIHNGADVRGGYTDARVFELEDPFIFYGIADAYAVTEDGTEWRTDNGWTWYTDNKENLGWEELFKQGIKEVYDQ